MNGDEKKHLLKKVTKSHLAIMTIIEGVDLELRVHEDTDWRIRDILGHIATWDGKVAKSLRAFMVGSEYSIPDLDDDETDFNEQAVTEQRKLSTHQLVSVWEQARADLKAAVTEIPVSKFPGDVLYPWGDERGSITKLVDFTIEHDEEHREEILKALQAPQ